MLGRSCRGFTPLTAGGLGAVAAAVLAAVGTSVGGVAAARSGAPSSVPRAAQAAPSASAASAKSAATVQVRRGPLGSYLVGPSGETLYYFASDKKHTSNCYGTCALGWPVLTVNAKPTAGKGVNASKLGTITRVGGDKQVTFDGLPLYYFVLDAKPGEIFGQDLPAFGGPWWMVNPRNGKAIKAAPPAAHVPAPSSAPKSLKLVVRKSSALGKYLTDSAGRTIYHFDADSSNHSKCTGLCGQVFPPVVVKSRASAANGVKSKLLGTIKLAHGIKQVTYDHMPLYYFALDGGRAGVANGQDQKVAGSNWWALAPNGKPIHKLIAANGPAAPKH